MTRTNVQTLTKPVAINRMSDAELMSAIRSQLRLTLESLRALSDLIKEARKRNLSLAEFSTGMASRLIAIADDKLDAELVFKFVDHAPLLDAVKGVPLDTQKELVRGGTVSVVEFDRSTNETTVRQKTLRQLTGPQARRVFQDGEIVSVAKQKQQFKAMIAKGLGDNPHRSPEKTDPNRGVTITADLDNEAIRVGVYSLSVRKFFPALKALGYVIAKAQ